MDKKIDIGLLRFLQPGEEPFRILTVESSIYLPALHRMLPKAELYAVTIDEEEPEKAMYRGLDIHWNRLDYRETPLAYEPEFFDYIMADRCLEYAVNPQDIAAGFSTFIRQTGVLLTSFTNVRHWKILREMMEGHFYPLSRHMFAKPEMEKLLYASFYKDVIFVSQRFDAPDDFTERLTAFGFDNARHDLDTAIWLVKAARSTPEIAALKSCYTVRQRRLLVTLLRRLEYHIEPERNLAAFWQLIDEAGIFPDYLAEFMRETLMHHAQTYKILVDSADAVGRHTFADHLLNAAMNCYTGKPVLIALRKLVEERTHG
jgi:hypothetical protein